MGQNVNAFEADLEAFVNSGKDGAADLDRKVVCLSAGTAAVHLALIGCGVCEGWRRGAGAELHVLCLLSPDHVSRGQTGVCGFGRGDVEHGSGLAGAGDP